MMQSYEGSFQVERDGELHVCHLPFRAGQVVHVSIREEAGSPPVTLDATGESTIALLRNFLDRPLLPEDAAFWEELASSQAELRRQGTSPELATTAGPPTEAG
jgi:hypothetical protein